jgi:hypothetical protein
MGFLVTEAQREALNAGGMADLPGGLSQILVANHARVLDWFRSVDTNFDGCISQGEMAYALHSLGINAKPKEVTQLFAALDPDGNGVVEFGELQDALRQGITARSAPKPKRLTAAQRERRRLENRAATLELREQIYEFERQRGLDEPGARPPPSSVEVLKKDRMDRLQEQARRAREDAGAGKSQPVARGELMSRMDSCWLKSPLLRPQTAPARVSQAAAAERRKAEIYDFWLNKHRAEIESHARVVEKEYADEKRMRRERVQSRRNVMLESMRKQKEASKLSSLERLEPFPLRKAMEQQRTALFSRQRERAWSQDIVFLPPTVAARESSLVKARRSADFYDSVQSVERLQ